MAKRAPWSERSGAERRKTFGGFALLYGVIAAVAIVLGWTIIGILFGLGAVGLFAGWYTTDSTDAAAKPDTEREKPAWMLAMDDPNAPDLSRPEYRTRPSDGADDEAPSPFDRPSTGEKPGSDPISPDVTSPREVPPSEEA